MKKILTSGFLLPVLLFATLIPITGYAQDFKLHENGVTITCDGAAPGSTGIVNGQTYTAVDRDMLISKRDANEDLSRVCTSSITDMNKMFYYKNVNGNLSTWDVSSVTNMFQMFRNSTSFNDDLSYWDVSSVTNMSEMFIYATSFNGDLSAWDVSSVTNMKYMFNDATAFNGNLSTWDVSSVTDMGNMFSNTSAFNGDLSEWDVSSVTNMSNMFRNATAFNGDLNTWDVSSVTDMSSMFSTATSFMGDISDWDVSSVTNMNNMFSNASAFNGDLSKWDVSSVTNMSNMFRNATAFNGDLSAWNVSSVIYMSGMFSNATSFMGDISDWDVSSVTHMSNMFQDATAFNGDLSAWDVSSVKHMNNIFSNASSFVGSISNWNVSSVSNMSYMFRDATAFNEDLSSWDISSVTNMNFMFQNAASFNGDLSSWQVSSVKNMSGMFEGAASFKGDLSSWDVSSVTNMNNMFQSATAFNGDLSSWDVSSVLNMSNMFNNAIAFKGDLSAWDVKIVNNMHYMFYNAVNFKTDLRSWCVTRIATLPTDFATNSALNPNNLPFWGECPTTVSISGTEGWRMLSSPGVTSYSDLLEPIWTQGIPGSKSPDNGSPNVQIFDGSTFQAVTDLTANIPAGQGFITYVYADDDYDGTPDPFPKKLFGYGRANSAPVLPPLSKGEGAWSLVGNPFTKTIGWNNIIILNNSLTGVVYVYDHSYGSNYTEGDIPETESGGGYRTWNGTTGSLAGGLIAAIQGFWMQNAVANPTLYIYGTSPSTGTFYKETSKKEENDQNEPTSIRLKSEMGNMFSETYLTFNEQASVEKDNFDALKLTPLDFRNYMSLSTLAGDQLLDINNLPSDFEQLEIPLSVSAFTANHETQQWESKAGTVTLSWPGLTIPEDWKITLNDYETGQAIDLTSTEKYEFSLTEIGQSMNKAVTSVLAPITPQVQKRAKSNSSTRFTLTLTKGKGVGTEPSNQPVKFALEQNYPNPFNPSTVISYQVAVNSEVRLEVFDMAGRKVATLVNGQKSAGSYQVTFDASGLSSGVYFYRLQSAGNIFTKQMTLIK